MSRVGQEIRSQHRYAFRTGQWALITGLTTICIHENAEGRGCYQLQWPDGVTDDWAIEDPVANYEFRTPKATEPESDTE